MSCSAHSQVAASERQVIKVNDVVIAHDAISAEVQNHAAATPVAAWTSAARALVVREVLLQEARRKSLVPAPISDEQKRTETDDEALVRQLIDTDVVIPSPTIEECRRYYEQNLKRFRSADLYEVSHILLSASKADKVAYARQQELAQAIIEMLTQKPELFGELARKHSDCPSAEHGGNLGQVTEGQTTPEFEEALMELQPGEVTKVPVETRYGHHVIHLARKVEGKVLPFEVVHEGIAEFLSERTQRFATAQYLARLVARADVSGVEKPSREELRVF